MTSFLIVYTLELLEERREELVSIISNYLEKALGLSEKIEDAYLPSFVYCTLCGTSLLVRGDLQAALKYSEKTLQQGEKSNDHFLLGMAYFLLNFVTPTRTHENPVGLERFEHGDMQANMIIRQKSLKVGENLNLEIGLVNAGKGPATLT